MRAVDLLMSFYMIFILHSDLSALCVVAGDIVEEKTYIDGSDPAIYYKLIERFESDTLIDTVYQSELIAELKARYASSENVVIASISKVTPFSSFPDYKPEIFDKESVTIKIEQKIKGAVSIDQSTFEYKLLDCYYDSISKQVICISGSGSTIRKPYSSALGMRFMLFLSNEEMKSKNLTIMLPGACYSHFDRFIIDASDSVYYDHFSSDWETNEIKSTPLMKIDLNQAIQIMTTTSVLDRTQRVAAKMFQVHKRANYNLLGKTIPGSVNRKNFSTNYILTKKKNNAESNVYFEQSK